MTYSGRARAMSLSQLLVELPLAGGVPECRVDGLCADSRRVKKGDLFLALSADAKQRQVHIETAITAGAVAILADPAPELVRPIDSKIPIAYLSKLRSHCGVIAQRYYGQPDSQLRVIGITGTNGKTSVSHFLAQLLDGSAIAPVGLIGTLGFGRSGRLTSHEMTTPGALEIQGIMASLVDEACRSVVMEVSSHALDQGRVADLDFDMAVLTNLTRDHLDYHNDMQAYADAKRKLFQLPRLRKAVINFDDAFGREILEQLPKTVTTVGYGLGELPSAANVRLDSFVLANDVSCNDQGLSMQISGSFGTARITTDLLGRFNVYNVLAATAAALAQGQCFETLCERIAQLQAVTGRFERFGGENNQPLVVVDFAHTPDGLTQALLSLRELSEGKIWCVFGCGGDRDRGKRAMMGEAAARWADHIIITSDNPRSESPEAIIDDIQTGITKVTAVQRQPDRALAIRTAIASAHSGDTVLIAGKGHETYQDIKGHRYPFSDQAVVRTALGIPSND